MATLAVQDGSLGVQSVTLVAAAGGGDSVPSGFRGGGWDLPVVLVVKNTDATAKTVTVTGMAPFVVPGVTGIAVIPVRGGVTFGELVAVTYSAVTGVTVGVVRLAKL